MINTQAPYCICRCLRVINNEKRTYMNFYTRILSVINEVLGEKKIQISQLDEDLISLDIDSITFISIVIALEQNFNFEFDDEMLLIANFPTLRVLTEYVKTKTF